MQHLLSKELVGVIRERTRQLTAASIDGGLDPQLGVVLVGSNAASLKFIDIKSRQAKEAGVIVSLYQLEEDTSHDEVEAALRFLAEDDAIHGIVLQLPLPGSYSPVDIERLISLIPHRKDVDGLRGGWQELSYASASLNSFLAYQPYHLPPMVASVLSLLDYYDIDIQESKKIVLVGQGRLVGRPLHAFLRKLGLPATVVTEETDDILAVTGSADILVSGTGHDGLITYQWVKEGAVVIDCASDVHADSVEQVASALAPSRGGVGPLTVAWLLHNLAQTANNLQEAS